MRGRHSMLQSSQCPSQPVGTSRHFKCVPGCVCVCVRVCVQLNLLYAVLWHMPGGLSRTLIDPVERTLDAAYKVRER